MTNRLPQWLKRPIPLKGDAVRLRKSLGKSSLITVCEEAKCPNLGECFCSGTATFMVMGESCSRTCRFCSVSKDALSPLQKDEKVRLLSAIREMKLNYVVITTVTRDDLPDGGSEHLAEIVRYLKREESSLKVEVLVSDFGGDTEAMKRVIDAGVDVIGHNVEMVSRLYIALRPEASYRRSLDQLKFAREYGSALVKTGIMVGLGETINEIKELFSDISDTGTHIVTVGQYLQPTQNEVKVDRFVTPEEFEIYREFGKKMNIRHVEAGPFVRSSYHANEINSKCNDTGCPVQ